MNKALQRHAVHLSFPADALVHHDLSGAAFAGPDWLFVAGDEACALERLQRQSGRKLHFGAGHNFPLADLLDLPGGPEEEADLEGLCLQDGWLWLVGSHGLKRRSPKPERSHEDNARRLAKTRLDGNRRLLACLPIELDAEGKPQPVKKAADGRRAARLPGDATQNLLTQLLAGDPHFAPFLAIPGKDNGFDIEGLAVDGERLLLGLRGPVLRGWTGLLELRLQRKGDQLRLRPLHEGGPLLHKHFLQLDGLGLRDLLWDGDDLLMLAGPTMALDGEIRLYRWPGARAVLGANREPVRFQAEGLQMLQELPHGRGCDRAEAIARLPGSNELLVFYDAPGPARVAADGGLLVDSLRTGS